MLFSSIEAAADVVTMTSTSEQQLMLLQAILNSRAEGIATVLERIGLPKEVASWTIPVLEIA